MPSMISTTTLPRAIVDSCVIIDFLNNHPKAIALFARLRSSQITPCISAITKVELFTFYGKSLEKQKLSQMLDEMECFPVVSEMAERVAQHMHRFRNDETQQNKLFFDAIIATTAEYYGYDICSANIRHFKLFNLVKSKLITYEN